MYTHEESTIQTTGIQWPNPLSSNDPQYHKATNIVSFEDAVKHVNDLKNASNGPSGLPQMTLGGRAIQLGKLLQERKQAQDLQKITLYLPKDLCSVLVVLKRQQLIESFSQAVKNALFQYLTKE